MYIEHTPIRRYCTYSCTSSCAVKSVMRAALALIQRSSCKAYRKRRTRSRSVAHTACTHIYLDTSGVEHASCLTRCDARYDCGTICAVFSMAVGGCAAPWAPWASAPDTRHGFHASGGGTQRRARAPHDATRAERLSLHKLRARPAATRDCGTAKLPSTT